MTRWCRHCDLRPATRRHLCTACYGYRRKMGYLPDRTVLWRRLQRDETRRLERRISA